jgi:AraC-like DNA-binding protein
VAFYSYFVPFTTGLAILLAAGLLMRSLIFRHVIFSIIIITVGYLNLFLFLITSTDIFNPSHLVLLDILNMPVILLLGPSIYFYMLSLTQDKIVLRKRDCMHFIPPVITAVLTLLIFIYARREADFIFYKNMTVHSWLSYVNIIIIGSMIAYFSVSISSVLRSIRGGNPVHHWILVYLTLVFSGLIIGFFGIVVILTQMMVMAMVINIFTSIIILGIFLFSQRYPYILQHGTVTASRMKHKSRLSKIDLRELDKQLSVLMREEKFFCDEDLTLKRLSDALEVTPHQLSEYLNEHHNKNFNSYINTFRINEAKELLLKEPNRNALSIAYASGFNSYSAFHSSFKKETGFSPADFRRSKLKEN